MEARDLPIRPISARFRLRVPRRAAAPHDERSRIYVRQLSPPGARPLPRRNAGPLGDRDRLARQQGFVDQQLTRLQQHAVGGDAVALGHQHDIAAHDLAAGNTPALAGADHQGTRARHRAQGIEHPFTADLLDDGDRNRQRGEGEQDGAAQQVAQSDIDRTPSQQEAEHRLPQDFQSDPPRAPPTGSK